MLWQLDVSLTNASVQDESGRIRGTEFKARAHLCTVCLCFPTLSRLVDELVIHADIESDVSPVFSCRFCLNLG